MSTKIKSYAELGFETLLVLFLLGFSTLIILQQSNPMLTTLGRDAGVFSYIGDQIRGGHIPYMDMWDNKPPGIYLVNALGLTLIKGSRWGVYAVEYLFLSLASLSGFLALRKNFGLASAVIATPIWLYGLGATLAGGNVTEEYSLLFGFLSMLLFVLSIDKKTTLRTDLGIGFCAGSSFLFRLNNTGPQVAILLTICILLLENKAYTLLIRRLITIGIGALIPTGILAIYLIPHNAFGAFWEASIIYNFAYSGNHFELFGSLSSGLVLVGFSGGIAALGAAMAWLETGARIKKQEGMNPIVLWISLSTIIEITLTGLSGRNYVHYFISWIPLIAFASALAISRSFPSVTEWLNTKPLIPLSASAVLLLICFKNVPINFYESITPLLSHAEITEKNDPVAQYLKLQTTRDQTVLAWGGQTGINFLAGRNSPTPYLSYPLYAPSTITNRISKDFYHDLTSNPPAYIVDYPNHGLIPLNTADPKSWLTQHQVYAPPYLTEILDFIQKNYVLETTITDVDIYHWKR